MSWIVQMCGMIERRRRPRLALEAVDGRLVARDALGQELQRDFAAELEVLGLVDDAHPAAAELGLNPIVADDGARRQRQHGRHCSERCQVGS